MSRLRGGAQGVPQARVPLQRLALELLEAPPLGEQVFVRLQRAPQLVDGGRLCRRVALGPEAAQELHTA